METQSIQSPLWVDKYRPRTLEKLDVHPLLSENLKKMCDIGDFPHLLIYGPPGSGKKTRIHAILRELYGNGIEKVKIQQREVKIPKQSKSIELVTLASNYHIEMNPSDAGYQDRLVVQEVIKEIASNVPIDTKRTFKVVVLHEVDKLSKNAQHALRRTMEKYLATCRVILCCNSLSKVIEPVRSRCLSIRIAAPKHSEITTVLNNIAKKEKFNLPYEISETIVQVSERNLRKAILALEATKVQQYPFKQNQVVERTDWEDFIIQLSKEIAEEQSPRRLMMVRTKLYELLSHCIPPETILKKLALELLKKLDSELKFEVIRWAAFYEHRIQQGTKPIYHLEAFVAKFMAIYKQFLIQLEEF